LVQKRAAKVIQIGGADGFFDGLQEKVAAQVDMQRPNPQSTALLVATGKRYLGRPEFRIQLNDLVADEYRQLRAKVSEPDLGAQGVWSPQEFCRRVGRFESATEPLARLFGVVGRWGDDPEYRLASEIMGDIGYKKAEGGLVAWIELRSYPAVLLLYAYGLGLTKARRYDLLLRWFLQPLHRDNRETRSVVQSLFLHVWPGAENGRWHNLEGLGQRKTPLSDHLHDITADWTADYTLADQEHTLLFEMFEVLGSLAFLTQATTAELKEAAERDKNQPFIWSPVGRAAWDSENRSVILSQLEAPETRAELLQGGFGRGDEEHLKLSIENVRRIMARIGWL
jgi:hypothetical protein